MLGPTHNKGYHTLNSIGDYALAMLAVFELIIERNIRSSTSKFIPAAMMASILSMTSFVCLLAYCCLLFLSFSPRITAYVPPSCAKNVSNLPVVCCPIPKGYSQPCGYPRLGACSKFQAYEDLPIKKLAYFYSKDVRMFWPMRVFQFGCHCRGRFHGVDCSECWYGFEGPNCDRRVRRIRRLVCWNIFFPCTFHAGLTMWFERDD